MMMRYDVIGSISDFESDRLGSSPSISALCPIGGNGRHTRFKLGHHSLVCRFDSCMGYEKNYFYGFFFWCSRINPSDRAKKGLYCDRLLVVLVIVLPSLHTAMRLSAIKVSSWLRLMRGT